MEEHKTDGTPCWCNPKILRFNEKGLEQEIVDVIKWEIRLTSHNTDEEGRQSANLIGLDIHGNEYSFQYWDGIIGEFRTQDITITSPPIPEVGEQASTI
jgi:hypothetical protein